MLFQLGDAGLLDFALAGRRLGLFVEGFPPGLPAFQRGFGVCELLFGGAALVFEFFDGRGQRRLLFPQAAQARLVALQLGAAFFAFRAQAFEFFALAPAGLKEVFDALLNVFDFRAEVVGFLLDLVVFFPGLGLCAAQLFGFGFGLPLGRERRFEVVLKARRDAILFGEFCVHIAQPQRQQLAVHQPLLVLQYLVTPRRARLAFEAAQLFVEFVADVGDALKVFPGMADAGFGFAPPVLVPGSAGGFFDEQAQIFGPRFDDAADHALLDDGVGARAEAGAAEQVEDVFAAGFDAVDEVVGMAVPLRVRRTEISAKRAKLPPAVPSALSKMSSTEALPTGLRAAEPLKITSAMLSPRNSLAEVSPITQRTASMMLDLPQPLGPTTATRSAGRRMSVRSTKDLKPEIWSFARRMGGLYWFFLCGAGRCA